MSALLAVVAMCAFAAPDRFVPNESLVTPRADLVDPEYVQKPGQMTWVDSTGHLWVAAVDKDTGMFKPSGAKGVLVDADALTSGDILNLVGNGPEWLLGQGPPRIVYTKFVPNQPHVLENARIAMVQKGSDGKWTTAFLSDQPRYRPYASNDLNDPTPRISYIDPHNNQYWREADSPSTETMIPEVWNPKLLAMRFVQGQRAAIFVAPINGDNQIARYWLDTKVVEQLTFDGGYKPTSSPFMWKAPEFGNDYVFAVSVNASSRVRVFRQLDKSQPVWSEIYAVDAPPGTKLISVEPFTYNGHSYLFMSGVVSPNTFASVLFLSGIDANAPLWRQLTPDTPLRRRTDPEYFITTGGPYIYFNRVDGDKTPPCPCPEGIYRAYTGLGP